MRVTLYEVVVDVCRLTRCRNYEGANFFLFVQLFCAWANFLDGVKKRKVN